MNLPHTKFIILLAIPFLLPLSCALVFSQATRLFGREVGYWLGFLFYWGGWCALVLWFLVGKEGRRVFFRDQHFLFSKSNWIAAGLFILIIFVTVLMYGKEFSQAPLTLILLAIPAATLNGLCEEMLWRGLYVKSFPGNFWLAVVFPAVGFAFWHLAPLQIYSDGNPLPFVLSTFFLGLAYGVIAFRTGSAKWTAISHSLNGILALSGALAPSLLVLLSK